MAKEKTIKEKMIKDIENGNINSIQEKIHKKIKDTPKDSAEYIALQKEIERIKRKK